MILKASQRGGGMQLAAHLLKSENEHVEVHEVRGFVSNDFKGAMKEAQAVAAGTRCKQHLFSVSLSPPESEKVGVAAFEAALDRIEQQTGLVGQPRMVVFHEKEGRRHCHSVWSRIDADTMTARPLPFFKMKLREVSKGLYLEHGWQMPRGLMDSKERDMRNFSLTEWQQAKRMGRDAKQVKALIQECWAVSDSRPALRRHWRQAAYISPVATVVPMSPLPTRVRYYPSPAHWDAKPRKSQPSSAVRMAHAALPKRRPISPIRLRPSSRGSLPKQIVFARTS